jgi:hypothetical protein
MGEKRPKVKTGRVQGRGGAGPGQAPEGLATSVTSAAAAEIRV